MAGPHPHPAPPPPPPERPPRAHCGVPSHSRRTAFHSGVYSRRTCQPRRSAAGRRSGAQLSPPPPHTHLSHGARRRRSIMSDLPDTHLSCQVGDPGSGVWSEMGMWGRIQGCIRREGTPEAALESVLQPVAGGRQSGWGRLLSVTNAIEAGTWR